MRAARHVRPRDRDEEPFDARLDRQIEHLRFVHHRLVRRRPREVLGVVSVEPLPVAAAARKRQFRAGRQKRIGNPIAGSQPHFGPDLSTGKAIARRRLELPDRRGVLEASAFAQFKAAAIGAGAGAGVVRPLADDRVDVTRPFVAEVRLPARLVQFDHVRLQRRVVHAVRPCALGPREPRRRCGGDRRRVAPEVRVDVVLAGARPGLLPSAAVGGLGADAELDVESEPIAYRRRLCSEERQRDLRLQVVAPFRVRGVAALGPGDRRIGPGQDVGHLARRPVDARRDADVEIALAVEADRPPVRLRREVQLDAVARPHVGAALAVHARHAAADFGHDVEELAGEGGADVGFEPLRGVGHPDRLALPLVDPPVHLRCLIEHRDRVVLALDRRVEDLAGEAREERQFLFGGEGRESDRDLYVLHRAVRR